MSQSKIINGQLLAEKHQQSLVQKIKTFKKRICIVSILVGEDPASLLYSKIKQKKASEVGIDFEIVYFQKDVSLLILQKKIEELNKDSLVTGIMVQLPLPRERFNDQLTDQVISWISIEKDVDGLTGKGLSQATIRGVLSILKDEGISIKGKRVGIVGVTGMIGGPLAVQLKSMGAAILGFNSKTKNLNKETSKADILISCVGKPNLIGKDGVKENAIVIDVGGDIDFKNVLPKVEKITPPKGGVGPMTVISLMENAYDLVI